MSLRLSGGRRLQSPPGLSARPTPARVRQAVMNILAAELPGCHWLDLCSGSGVMACEALRRGAARVVAVEHDRRHAAVVEANLLAVAGMVGKRPQAVAVVRAEVVGWLRAGRQGAGLEPFHLIYADPPYASGIQAPIAASVAVGDWLRPGGELLLECATAALPAIPAGWRTIDQRGYGTTTVLRLQPG